MLCPKLYLFPADLKLKLQLSQKKICTYLRNSKSSKNEPVALTALCKGIVNLYLP